MAIKQIGGFILRSAALTIVADGVRRLAGKIPLPSGTSTRLSLRDRELEIGGDKISNRTAIEIKDLLLSEGIDRAEVSIRKDGRVAFSGVPESIQQRIRNILKNQ